MSRAKKKSQVNGVKSDEDEEVCVACMPATVKSAVPGSTQKKCSSCGIAIWVSPATLSSVAKFPKYRFLCVECLAKEAAEDKPEFLPPSQQQLDELRQALDSLDEDEGGEST
jgi:hypothetical protein